MWFSPKASGLPVSGGLNRYDDFVGRPILKTMVPIRAAATDAPTTANFAESIRVLSSNESAEMKMAMVNPMPPKKPAPMICFADTSLGNVPQRIFKTRDTPSRMPTGFPTSRPMTMPKTCDCERNVNILELNEAELGRMSCNGIAMLDKTNSGRTMP